MLIFCAFSFIGFLQSITEHFVKKHFNVLQNLKKFHTSSKFKRHRMMKALQSATVGRISVIYVGH